MSAVSLVTGVVVVVVEEDASLKDAALCICLDLLFHLKFGPASQRRHISVSSFLTVENSHLFLRVWKVSLVYICFQFCS